MIKKNKVQNIFSRIHTIFFCGLLSVIGCSDDALNNAVKPPTEDTEVVVRAVDKTLRITGYEKGPFEWFTDREGEYVEGIYTAEYQRDEVWLYGFHHGDLVVGTVIDEPEIIDDWRKKVTNVITGKKRNVRFLKITLPD